MEGISARIFEVYQDVIRDQISKQHGIYALYKRDRLYYVGLARNLRSRLWTHLRDRHHGLWDNFSVYLTTEADHIRELELLVLRILRPKGNKVLGKFPGSTDLKKVLARELRRRQRAELDALVGRKRIATEKRREFETSLGPYLDRRLKLEATYKGETFRATVRRDGWIRYNGHLYASPSDIAKEIMGRPVSGWHFWKYERSPGKWVRLKSLKK
jgi:hypothetical protein